MKTRIVLKPVSSGCVGVYLYVVLDKVAEKISISTFSSLLSLFFELCGILI